MKKCILTFVGLLCITCSLTSCKEKTQIERAQDKIVEIGKQYLNYELTPDEAVEKLHGVIIPDIEGNGDLYLEVDKDNLAYTITLSEINRSVFSDIEDKVKYIESRNYNY